MNEPSKSLQDALGERYRVERELGRGGMAMVFLARDLKHERPVAIKVMDPALAADGGAERFLREIGTAAALRHPHILPLFDSGSAGTLLFYVMPFVEGRSLRDRIDREGPLPVEDAVRIAREVADALAHAHGRGVVHRDIKPENVLLDSGHALVADFGIARVVQEASADSATFEARALTGPGMVVGTPAYMSPEQATGRADVDGRSDQYALACVLFEMLAGQPPFTGPSASNVLQQQVAAPPRPVTDLRPSTPPAAAAAIARALAKAPVDRFPNVTEFADALAAPATGTPASPAAAPSAARRPRARTWVVAALAVAVLAAAAFVAWRGRPAPVRDAGTGRLSVAVLEFDNVTGDPSLDWMKRGAPELLGSALVQSPSLDVFDLQRLRDLAAAGDANTAPSNAVLSRHRIRRVIAGSILRDGNLLRLQSRIVDTGDGRTLNSWAVESPADSGLFPLVGRLIPGLQVALEVNLAGDRETDAWLREITTTSVDAYRFYLRGHEALLASRFREAASALEQALALDSTFVAARTDLAGALWNLGDDAALQLTRAAMQRLRTRADHRGRLRIDLFEAVVGRSDPAALVRAASGLLQYYPENRFYTYLLGRGYFWSGDYRRCLKTLKPLVEQRYGWSWTYALSARSAGALGDDAEARRLFRLGLEVTNDDPALTYEYLKHLGKGADPAERRARIAAGLASPEIPESPVAEGELRLERAKDLLADGDVAGAKREMQRSLRLLPRNDEAWPEADSLARHLGVR